MTDPDNNQPGIWAAMDWRILFGLIVTTAWLFMGSYYIFILKGWAEFLSQDQGDMGSFLEGAFAPLAFLWLVVGFFLQQQQLHENTSTIKKQLEEMRATEEGEETYRAYQDAYSRAISRVGVSTHKG